MLYQLTVVGRYLEIRVPTRIKSLRLQIVNLLFYN